MHKHSPRYRCADHLFPLINPKNCKRLVRLAVKVLKRYEFDTIAFRGLSGALIAPIIAMRMNKHLVAIRKGESCHSSHQLEGNVATERYVIVDDFISSGETVRKIVQEIYSRNHNAVCVGFLGTAALEGEDDDTVTDLRKIVINMKGRADVSWDNKDTITPRDSRLLKPAKIEPTPIEKVPIAEVLGVKLGSGYCLVLGNCTK